MSFLSMSFLFGLLSVAVPIVIHLIHRQRYPDRAFTTLRFFDKTVKHNVIQQKLIDRVLLALRILALVALVFGLARPFMRNDAASGASGIGERRRSVVIVLDNSPSMGRMREGKTLFDRAKSAAIAVLDQLQANSGNAAADSNSACDEAELILTSGPPSPAYSSDKRALKEELALHAGQPVALLAAASLSKDKKQADENAAAASRPEFSADAARLVSAIDRAPDGLPLALVSYGSALEPKLHYNLAGVRAALEHAEVSALPGNIRSAIAAGARTLRSSHDGERRMIVLTDLQKSEWSGAKTEDVEGLSITLGAIDPPADEGANLGIEDVTTAMREAVLGQSVMCTAVVRNYGTRPSDQAALIVTAGDRGRATEIKLPTLPPGTSTLVSFPINVMTRERNLLCSATLKCASDSFNYDDSWFFQIGVRPPVTTLCVNGVPASSVSDRETFFVMNALAPRPGTGNGRSGQTEILADARECEIGDLKNQQLFQYGVIVLCGVTTLDANARESLRRFVNDGGGLVVLPGTKAALEDYNAWGFLPARMIERKSSDFAYVKSIADEEPAIAGVKQRVGAGINALSTNSWIKLEPEAEARVLANLSTGAPALVQGRVGKGTVILSAVGGHASESDWPLRPAFVILMRSLVKFLGSPAAAVSLEPERSVGEGASALVAPEFEAGTPALFRLRPGEKVSAYDSLPWYRNDSASATASTLVLPRAESSGHYLLSVQPGTAEGLMQEPGLGASVRPVSVNHGSLESILEPLALNDVNAILPGAKIIAKRLPENSAESAAIVLSDLDTGRDLWRWLVFAALAFLMLESVVAGRTSSETAG